MSAFDEIEHLDWNPDPGLGLRDRALEAFKAKQQRKDEELAAQCAELLLIAQARMSDVLDIVNADNCRVEPKDRDGDGDVYFDADGMQFKVGIVYPVGGGPEPQTVSLSVKCRSGWLSIRDLETLGQYLDNDNVKLIDPEEK